MSVSLYYIFNILSITKIEGKLEELLMHFLCTSTIIALSETNFNPNKLNKINITNKSKNGQVNQQASADRPVSSLLGLVRTLQRCSVLTSPNKDQTGLSALACCLT